jgi:hypothetical protein
VNRETAFFFVVKRDPYPPPPTFPPSLICINVQQCLIFVLCCSDLNSVSVWPARGRGYSRLALLWGHTQNTQWFFLLPIPRSVTVDRHYPDVWAFCSIELTVEGLYCERKITYNFLTITISISIVQNYMPGYDQMCFTSSIIPLPNYILSLDYFNFTTIVILIS